MSARQLILLTAIAVILSGCGRISESRFNPFNWFRSDSGETLAPADVAETRDPRPLVADITSLVVERTPGGAIVRATALPGTQGWFAPELVSATRDGDPVDGVLSFAFRAAPPDGAPRVSTVRSRELAAAVFVTDLTLANVRIIQVTGARNSRVARR